MQAGLEKIRGDMTVLTNQIGEAEQRISDVEDAHMGQQSRIQMLEKSLITMTEKLEDLENRSRRNNLRIVGLPESIKTAEIYKICTQDLPKALGTTKSAQLREPIVWDLYNRREKCPGKSLSSISTTEVKQ